MSSSALNTGKPNTSFHDSMPRLAAATRSAPPSDGSAAILASTGEISHLTGALPGANAQCTGVCEIAPVLGTLTGSLRKKCGRGGVATGANSRDSA